MTAMRTSTLAGADEAQMTKDCYAPVVQTAVVGNRRVAQAAPTG